MRRKRTGTAILCLFALVAIEAQAQVQTLDQTQTLVDSYQAPKAPLFPTQTYFRKHFGTAPTHIELQPPVHFQDYVVDGKLVLSLKSYLDLVMENNTDVSIQKVLVESYANQITRAFSVFDPFANASFNSTRTKTPSNTTLAGANTLNQLQQPLSVGITQVLPTGGQYNVQFGGTKFSTNSAFATFNPSITSSVGVNFSQPLLRDRGLYITKLPITIARGQLRSGIYTLQDQVTGLLSTAESAYWDVVEAYQDVRVREQALQLAETALQRTKRELELGATSPLDIFQPEQQFANAQLTLTQARYRVKQVEDALRRQMGADLDPAIRELPIELTESPVTTIPSERIDRESTLQQALATRFDLKSFRQNIDVDDLNIKLAQNSLRPDLSLNAGYSSFGQGGVFYDRQSIIGPDGQPSQAVTVIPGGLGDALNQLFGFGYPTYSVGLSLRFPFRDRRATADLADAVMSKKADALRARVAEENIRLQVLTAINQVERSRDSVSLAATARDFAQKRVEAEQKKYDLGTTTIFFVLAAQTELTQAESTLVRERINYRRNLLNLYTNTGELLGVRGVAISK